MRTKGSTTIGVLSMFAAIGLFAVATGYHGITVTVVE